MIAADAICGDRLPAPAGQRKKKLVGRPYSLNYVLQDVDDGYRAGGDENDEQ